ncbi:MAG: ribosome biogenesis GTPase Der [Eubacteriales bacterium]|nr:ribosome biogenesis GTPase Der [Eubacteriales bacterium]
MKRKPIVAIVGRPNVGKSTFFNRMIGRHMSIVEDTPGVTRDRLYADAKWQNFAFTLVDTGGIEMNSDDVIKRQMKTQAQLAAETADLILFFVDGKTGLTAEDYDVADYLRRTGKDVLLVVNKMDNASREDYLYEYYELGIGVPLPVSSVHGLGTGDVLDAIADYFDHAQLDEEDADVIKIAVVGKPNAGKSSLVNSILGEERSIVSDRPGTTRDAVDTPFTHEGRDYVIMDTAGIRRKARIEDNSIERFSVVRALSAVRRSDVALLMVDAVEGVSDQDAKIAGYIQEAGKPVVVLVNKWALVDKDHSTVNEYTRTLRAQLPFMDYAPVLFISCKTGQRLPRVLEMVDTVLANARRKITTGLLNDVINDATAALDAPSVSGRRLRIYYSTQVGQQPPEFLLFVNNAELMRDSYRRYLENHLRKTFDFTGTPLVVTCRNRKENE